MNLITEYNLRVLYRYEQFVCEQFLLMDKGVSQRGCHLCLHCALLVALTYCPLAILILALHTNNTPVLMDPQQIIAR